MTSLLTKHVPANWAKKGNGSHQSRRRQKVVWLTPPLVLEALGPFDLDPCAATRRPWPTAATQYTKKDNGLKRPWFGRVFCNPPYDDNIAAWLRLCAAHENVTALIFARTETDHWHQHVWPEADSVLFLRGRLFFHHTDGKRAAHNGGAPSALVAYDKRNTRALEQCRLPGHLVRLKS